MVSSCKKHDDFMPHFDEFQRAIDFHVKELEKYQEKVQESDSYDYDFKKAYKEEERIQDDVKSKFDKFSFAEIEYDEFKKFVCSEGVGNPAKTTVATIDRNSDSGKNTNNQAKSNKVIISEFGMDTKPKKKETYDDFGNDNNAGYDAQEGENDWGSDFNNFKEDNEKPKKEIQMNDLKNEADKQKSSQKVMTKDDRMFSFGGVERSGKKSNKNLDKGGKKFNSVLTLKEDDNAHHFGDNDWNFNSKEEKSPFSKKNEFNFNDDDFGIANNVDFEDDQKGNQGFNNDFGNFGNDAEDVNLKTPAFGEKFGSKIKTNDKNSKNSQGFGNKKSDDKNDQNSQNFGFKNNDDAFSQFAKKSDNRESLRSENPNHKSFNRDNRDSLQIDDPFKENNTYNDYEDDYKSQPATTFNKNGKPVNKNDNIKIKDDFEDLNQTTNSDRDTQNNRSKTKQTRGSTELDDFNNFESSSNQKKNKKSQQKSSFIDRSLKIDNEGTNEPIVRLPNTKENDKRVDFDKSVDEIERLRIENEFYKNQSELLFQKLNSKEKKQQDDKANAIKTQYLNQKNEDKARLENVNGKEMEITKITKIKQKAKLYADLNNQIMMYAEELKREIRKLKRQRSICFKSQRCTASTFEKSNSTF